MGFFRRIAGLLGFVKDDLHESTDEADDQAPTRFPVKETGLPRKGFGVPVQVAVDRPQIAPLLAPRTSGDGGVQFLFSTWIDGSEQHMTQNWKKTFEGLRWYAKRLRIDEDGDVADEFLDEVPGESSALTVNHHKTMAKFKVNYGTRPVKVKRQVLSDGKLQQCVEHQGRLQWV